MKELQEEISEYQDIDDTAAYKVQDIVVYSRDWTIGTIFDQIDQGNIELNPKFQRRNAWTDSKRSKLIESIIMGYPIPEIVLAEDKTKKRSYIVIDGKQRLLTLAGFIDNGKYGYWDVPKLSGITIDKDVKGMTYDDFKNDTDLRRNFENAALRCTVIMNYSTDDVLYDIFYRLNAGSTPLSSQELRQSLYRGGFSNFLLDVTSRDSLLWNVMGIDEADKRLRDVEVLLRLMAFIEYGKSYQGNLRQFLDKSMKDFNVLWESNAEFLKDLYNRIIHTIAVLKEVFTSLEHVGRKYKNGSFEKKFNRVMLEIQVFFFYHLPDNAANAQKNEIFVNKLIDLCTNDSQFLASFEGSTKNINQYKIRYSRFQKIFNESYNLSLDINPFGAPQ